MSYLSYDELSIGTQLLAEEYQQHCQLIQLPNPSVETRSIFGLAIGDNRDLEAPTAIYVGGVHAREWVPPDALLFLCADLLEARSRGTGLRYCNTYIS